MGRLNLFFLFGGIWVFSLIIGNMIAPPSKKITENQAVNVIPTPTVAVTSTPTPIEETITNKINKLALKNYPSFEVTIFDENSNIDSKAKEPFEIVLNAPINGTIFNNCDEAKKIAYYTLEALYMNTDIRNKIDRVLISFPRYLRVSLGASDGVPMADKNNFSGPINFWKVIEVGGFTTENETGPWKNRTWATYLQNCQ